MTRSSRNGTPVSAAPLSSPEPIPVPEALAAASPRARAVKRGSPAQPITMSDAAVAAQARGATDAEGRPDKTGAWNPVRTGDPLGTVGASSGEEHPLRIEHLPPDSLTPWAKNARTHSRKQIRQIADSIETFGFTNPVLIDAQDTILAGHGRVEAAKLLGLAHVPCVRLENLTPAQRRAYVLADNKLAMNAGWDEELLGEELAALMGIEDLGFELSVTGFSIAEVDTLVEGLSLEEPGDPREDALPTAAQAPRRVQLGDVWQLGPHRLVCGDALDPAVVAQLMTGPAGEREEARMVFSDPPYNVPIDGHVITRKPSPAAARGAKGKGRGRGAAESSDEAGGSAGEQREPPAPRHREFAMASGEMSREQFTAFLISSLQNMADHAVEGSIHFLCMDWRHQREMLDAGETVYGEPKNLIVWAKDNGGMGSFYRSRHELIFAFKKGSAPHVNSFELGQHGRYRTNVWEYAGVNTRRAGRLEELALHPTVKPVQMIADAIKDVSGRGEIVLDLFGGSGSTLIAAEKTGRRARLVEIDPLYCDRIIARWEAYAHCEAERVDGNRTAGEHKVGQWGRRGAANKRAQGGAKGRVEREGGRLGMEASAPSPSAPPAKAARTKRAPPTPQPAKGAASVSSSPAAPPRGHEVPRSPGGRTKAGRVSSADGAHEEVQS